MSSVATEPIIAVAPSITAEQEVLAIARSAVATIDQTTIVSILKQGLAEMARRGAFATFEFPPPQADRYARRLVFSDAWERFTIIAMTWGVGHQTALHDHAGTWCVEVVVAGDMEVVNYQMMEEISSGLCRFERRETVSAPPASSGTLIPPFEHHIFANVGATPSHTLHVYGGPMNRCNVFEPVGGGWWQRLHRDLRYDA